jgi:signal peptidase I
MLSKVLLEIWGFLRTLAIAGFIAFFCIRGFIFEPFKIPSSSMMPTLLIGDFLVVTKFAYGNRIPMTDHFIWQTAPKRGDIVVFKRTGSGLPGSFFGLGDTLFIKRLVGLPGDKIAYTKQTLYINGKAVSAEKVGTYDLKIPTGETIKADLLEEDLLGVKHAVLRDPNAPGPEVAETVVPDGMYVMMGDNRDNSLDSRFWQWPSWGFVPKADVMGRAEFIFWSWDENWIPRFGRMGTGLRAHHEEPEGQVLNHAKEGYSA